MLLFGYAARREKYYFIFICITANVVRTLIAIVTIDYEYILIIIIRMYAVCGSSNVHQVGFKGQVPVNEG